ncbi:MAG TPA: aminotransferase class I/II-fold pyridoxal phosphate-dependent enzyme [Vicinamibacterales bacterium]|nr:aminotransferase class I/II-fold pyridoxal phosphate-dependent enzyme [Vicinamibacterales bacterium]
MSLSRRAFVRSLGGAPAVALPSAPHLAARGREAFFAEGWPGGFDSSQPVPPQPPDVIQINSNENPLGPGPAALKAIESSFANAGRYPMNAKPALADLRALLATSFKVKPENVALGAGSGELLIAAVRAFTSPTKAFVTAAPSFESPQRTAEAMQHPVKAIPVTAAGKLDLDQMATAARGAGLVFFCNPNNPTATVHSAAAVKEFVAKVRKDSPDTAILLDEAYHEYVTDPAYATGAPFAMEADSRVFVTRTFSKCFGMAGMRAGYAIGSPTIIKAMAPFLMPYNVSVPALAAAHVAFQDAAHIEQERARNTAVRKYTLDFFKSAGMTATDSQANFLFVDIRRTPREFREACRKHGVHVGRDFPPLDRTHCRISIGTMDEMKRATDVFAKVLGTPTTTANR